MALFSSYAAPGVFTFEQFIAQAATANVAVRIPVFIGEGQQFFTFNNVELFRGSSSVADDQSVNENISDQCASGLTQSFQTTFYPVVDGSGKGITTNNPALIQCQAVYSNGNVVPVTVISLVGATGQFVTQDIIPAGTDLTISYYFKRGDTYIQQENDTFQVPQYAVQTVAGGPSGSPAGTGSITHSLTKPGATGNLVTLQFINSGKNIPDAQAVIGAGTDAITIDISGPTGQYFGGIRTLQSLYNLVNLGNIPTLDGGYLTSGSITGDPSAQLTVSTGATPFAGGVGQGSNTVFQEQNIPITDGTNGGIVTTTPTNVIAMVNGNPVTVSAVNGAQGLVTLASSVAYGQTLTFTYYTNTWQNTYDLLPSANVASITQIGLGPNTSTYNLDVDFSLGVAYDRLGNPVANTVNWGNNVSTVLGTDNTGDTPFSPAEVLTTSVDEVVWLRLLSGAVNGKNAVFTLPDTPTTGSGNATPTNNPNLVTVYVGVNPLVAFQSGAVTVAAVNGLAQQVTLYNPPPAGTNVYASYYRNTLEDQEYTLTVVQPGFSGFGTYVIQDNLNRYMPLVTFNAGSSSVTQEGAFAATGIVYPFNFSDAVDDNGSPTETVTLTFNNDGNATVIGASQATLTIPFASGSLTFVASTTGVGGNDVQIAIDTTTINPQPVVVQGNLVTIYAFWNGTLNTSAQIASYFPSAETTNGGQITALSPSGSPRVTAATSLTGGQNATTTPVTHSYTVTSNLATGTGTGGSNIGYLDQTYIDLVTGFRVTIVNPADHVAYGITSLPQSYNFVPGDRLVFNVNTPATGSSPTSATSLQQRYTGTPSVPPCQSNNEVAIFGCTTKVTSTFGSTAGDSVIVTTVRGSGNEPAIGTYYYVSYTTNKVASDYACKIYTNPSDAYAAYGQPSTINRLSLGIQLAALNGMQTFGAIQVPVQQGTNLASSADYIAALQQLKSNLPGFNTKANVVVPLSNDPVVHQALSNQLSSQATARYKGEAIGFVGYSQFTTANQARANARSLLNQRVVAIGNAAAGVLVTNSTTFQADEYLVDGPFMAAALAGANCNPANDVATNLVLQNLVGFSRLLITYDDATMDLMASDGLTLLLNNNGALQIRDYLTTNPANDLTRIPTSTTIADYTAQAFRADLQQFVGRKIKDSLLTDITNVCIARLTSEVSNYIITAYDTPEVRENPNDPTEVDVTVTFKPMFCLLYLVVTFNVVTVL